MRGTGDVVTSLCADEMTGVLPTSTSESKVCKARLGSSARTTTRNSRSSSAGSPRKRTRSRRRCLRVRPRSARSRVNSTTRPSRAELKRKITTISVHHEDLDHAVDPIIGWRFYKRSRGNLQTTSSGSRANLQTASSSSSKWDQTHWKTSRFRLPGEQPPGNRREV